MPRHQGAELQLWTHLGRIADGFFELSLEHFSVIVNSALKMLPRDGEKVINCNFLAQQSGQLLP